MHRTGKLELGHESAAAMAPDKRWRTKAIPPACDLSACSVRTFDMKLFPILCATALGMVCVGVMGDEAAPAPSAKQVIAVPNTPDGFTILNDRVYFIRRGQIIPLTQEVTLRVSPNGTITAFDGTTYVIPRGQVLTLTAGMTAISSAAQAAVNAASGGGTEAAANQAATEVQQAPGPALSDSPFTRFHQLDAAGAQALNPQLTYPVPNDSPFTRFHSPPVPQESKSKGVSEVPNNAPVGPLK